MAKSSRPEITEVNCETGEVIIRPMDDAEFANYQKLQQSDETLA